MEDEFLLATLAQDILESAGFEVVAMANQHTTAVSAALKSRPDIILMDVNLADGSSGISAAIEIFVKTGIRSLFVSASGNAENRRLAEPAHPLGWIAKPYKADDLIAVVSATLESYRGVKLIGGGLLVEIDHSHRLVRVRAQGPIFLGEMLDYFDKLASAGAMPYAKLFDARSLDSRLNDEDFDLLGRRVRENSAFDPRGNIGAVATSAHGRAAVERFKALGGAERKIELFETVESASAWLAKA
ncbi:MAG: response regulator [Proteobacteria bacterium]|nr:response regulator [Pseudomonadota bacterium]